MAKYYYINNYSDDVIVNGSSYRPVKRGQTLEPGPEAESVKYIVSSEICYRHPHRKDLLIPTRGVVVDCAA